MRESWPRAVPQIHTENNLEIILRTRFRFKFSLYIFINKLNNKDNLTSFYCCYVLFRRRELQYIFFLFTKETQKFRMILWVFMISDQSIYAKEEKTQANIRHLRIILWLSTQISSLNVSFFFFFGVSLCFMETWN